MSAGKSYTRSEEMPAGIVGRGRRLRVNGVACSEENLRDMPPRPAHALRGNAVRLFLWLVWLGIDA